MSTGWLEAVCVENKVYLSMKKKWKKEEKIGSVSFPPKGMDSLLLLS
jgi:hypothetical protein